MLRAIRKGLSSARSFSLPATYANGGGHAPRADIGKVAAHDAVVEPIKESRQSQRHEPVLLHHHRETAR